MFIGSFPLEMREKFLELVYKLAHVDGEYAEEEAELVRSYQVELGIEYIKETGDIEELVDFFAAQDETARKICLFELLGVVKADGVVSAEETELIDKVQSAFGLTRETVQTIGDLVEELQNVYDKIYQVLF